MPEETAGTEGTGVPVKLVVDGEKLPTMTFGEWEALLLVGRRLTPELIALLDRIIVGGVRHLPFSLYNDALAAVNQALTQRINPTDDDGKN